MRLMGAAAAAFFMCFFLLTKHTAGAFSGRSGFRSHSKTWQLYSQKYRRSSKSSSSPATLDWETFEFSERPKWVDVDAQRAIMETEHDIDQVAKVEAQRDRAMAKRFQERLHALDSLPPKLVQDATNVLLPFVNDERLEKMDSVLKKRTQHTRFLFENPSNPSNVWACMRTIDSFGIQHVDIVIDSTEYKGKSAIAQKSGMRSAMGSAQWLTIHNYVSTKSAIEELRDNKGYKIYASDLNPNSKDIRDIDWGDESGDDRPICIVMGNEGSGISDEMRALADETFTLPMCGFAESFNLSVATAITLAHLSACSKDSDKGPIRPGDLSEHEFNVLKLKGILHSVQKRTSRALLNREGIELPEAIGWI